MATRIMAAEAQLYMQSGRRMAELSRWFHFLLAFCPFLMGAVYALVNLTGGWGRFSPTHGYAFYFLTEFPRPVLLTGMVLAVVSLVWLVAFRMVRHEGPVSRRRVWMSALVVFGVALLLRILAVGLNWGEWCPVSDFKMAWDRACGQTIVDDYHRFSPSWVNFALFLKGVAGLSGASFDCALLTGSAFGAVTAGAVYLVAREAFGIERPSLFAGLLFAVNPSHVLYVTTATPEHAAIAFYSLSLWMACRMLKSQNRCATLCWAALTGLSLGMGEVFKPFSAVVLVALALSSIVWACVGQQGRGIRRLGWLVACMLTASVCSIGVIRSVTFVSGRVFGVNFVSGSKLTHSLVVGLNRLGEGQVHVGPLSHVYDYDLRAGVSPEKAAMSARRRILEDWSGHWNEVIPFFFKKTVWAWQEDNASYLFFLRSCRSPDGSSASGPRRSLRRLIVSCGQTVECAWYMVLMALAFWGALRIICARVRGSYGIFLLGMVVFGYFCMVLLSEAQSRYKCLVIPCICVYAALGAFGDRGVRVPSALDKGGHYA